MEDQEILIPCSVCGQPQPRAEMFGAAPDLLCQRCRDGVSQRLNVRFRPLARNRKPVVTFGLIGLAGIIYLLDHLIFGRAGFQPQGPVWWQSMWYALHVSEVVWTGTVYSLLSSAFFHGFFLHFFFNAWWILSLGRATESGFGPRTLLLLVVGGAMVASAAEWIANGSGEGLSGVVYALAFFLYVHHKTNPFAAAIMNRRTINYLSMWFVLCIVLTMAGSWHVANWAHGGGAVWGWLAGQATLHANRRRLVPALALGTILIVVLSVFVVFGTVKMAGGDTWSRSHWRTYWLEHHSGE